MKMNCKNEVLVLNKGLKKVTKIEKLQFYQAMNIFIKNIIQKYSKEPVHFYDLMTGYR